MRESIERRYSLSEAAISSNNEDDDTFILEETIRSRSSVDLDIFVHESKKSKAGNTSILLYAHLTTPLSFFALADIARNTSLKQEITPTTGLSPASQASSNSTLVPDTPSFKRPHEDNSEQQVCHIAHQAITSSRDIQPLALNPELRFKDGAIPILYKEKNNAVLLIMKKREEKLTLNNGSLIIDDYLPKRPPYAGLTLIPMSANKWAIYDGISHSLTNPQPGLKYAFVTMPDKSIRVIPDAQGAHILIANQSPAVRYAGNITFNEQNEIITWDNASGAYKPSASLMRQARFYADDLVKFRPYNAPNDCTQLSSKPTASL